MKDLSANATEIIELEKRLHSPKARRDAAFFDSTLAADFLEFGASGRVYDKATIIQALDDGPLRDVLSAEGFQVKWLSEDAALLTYQSTRIDSSNESVARAFRSSIWRWIGDRWQIVFHQGTPTEYEFPTIL
jgi:hypothetical protein